jgi:predicted RNA-binding Zn-ribbon protein involved in translation (DUF1610 family)
LYLLFYIPIYSRLHVGFVTAENKFWFSLLQLYMLTQQCPHCKSILKCDETLHQPGETVEMVCPLCGETITFVIPLVEVKKEEPKAPEVLVQPLESETQTPSVSSVPTSEPVPESESESEKEECTGNEYIDKLLSYKAHDPELRKKIEQQDAEERAKKQQALQDSKKDVPPPHGPRGNAQSGNVPPASNTSNQNDNSGSWTFFVIFVVICVIVSIFVVKSCSKSEEIKGAGDSTLADSAAVADSAASPVPIDSSAMSTDSASASPEPTSEQSSEDDYTSAGFPRWLVGSWSGHFEGGDVGSYDCTVRIQENGYVDIHENNGEGDNNSTLGTVTNYSNGHLYVQYSGDSHTLEISVDESSEEISFMVNDNQRCRLSKN